MISFFAKKARGRMAAWLIKERVNNIANIREFDLDGYSFSAELSRGDDIVFTRPEGA